MISEQQLVHKWRNLTPAKQQEVLSLFERLESEDADQLADGTLSVQAEIWTPYGTPEVIQALQKLIEEDPGEEFD